MRLIDADAITDDIRRCVRVSSSPWTHWGMVQKIVNDQKTVHQVKHGKWIKVENHCYSPFDRSSEYQHFCSCCHEEGYATPYCPNCGARMDGDE